jgi:hypothetical protein
MAPLLGTAIAQPELAGSDIGWLVHRVRHHHRLAAVEHDPGGLVGIADGARIEAVRHVTIGDHTSTLHRLGELGVFPQPVVDGAVAHVEAVGQVQVGGAGQAKLEGLRGEFRLVERRPSGPVHDRSSRRCGRRMIRT